jgi:hypothetical protein
MHEGSSKKNNCSFIFILIRCLPFEVTYAIQTLPIATDTTQRRLI